MFNQMGGFLLTAMYENVVMFNRSCSISRTWGLLIYTLESKIKCRFNRADHRHSRCVYIQFYGLVLVQLLYPFNAAAAPTLKSERPPQV